MNLAHTQTFEISPMAPADAPLIEEITQTTENVLPRTLADLNAENVTYFVAKIDGSLVGCVGYKIWEHRAEIISLAVISGYQGLGIGAALLQTAIAQAVSEGYTPFAITHPKAAKRVFLPSGFHQVPLETFEGKILQDCAVCPENILVDGKLKCSDSAYILGADEPSPPDP